MTRYNSTSELISDLYFENGNPEMSPLSIDDNGDDTITVIIEGFCEEKFPKPLDYDSYVESLEN